MFGRKRHVAPAAAPPVPTLTEDQVFDLVHTRLSALVGERGTWTLSRRSKDDTDIIFHGAIARSIAAQITGVLQTERHKLEAGEATASTTEPAIVEAVEPDDEAPASPSWLPAPITKWADLRRPVTGEIPQVARAQGSESETDERALVA